MIYKLRSYRFLISACLISVALADWLFYEEPPGWTLGIYGMFVLSILLLRNTQLLQSSAGKVMIGAAVTLSLAMVAQPGPLVFCMIFLALTSLAIVSRSGWTSNSVEWFGRWIKLPWKSFVQLVHDIRLQQRLRKTGHGKHMRWEPLKAVRNWGLPVTGSIFFLAIFSGVNPLLADWMQQVQYYADRVFEHFDLSVPRILFWTFVGTGMWGLLRSRIRKQAPMNTTLPVSSTGLIQPSIIVRCLALFNAVFLLQTITDLIYLYGGRALPNGMSYAYYAHRGAYPLIATALLAGIFVLISFRAGLPTNEMRIARQLVYLWLTQNVLLIFSSLFRLHLYIGIYSMTRWRIAAAIWMALVATGLISIAIRIWTGRSNRWLINTNFASALCVLYLCCFVNFDSLIAWHNVRHCRELGGQEYYLDISYLRSLGPEALPALDWLAQSAPATTVGSTARVQAVSLRWQLQRQTQNWRGWTYRNYLLSKYVQNSPGIQTPAD